MSEKNTGTITVEVDLDNLPPLSEEHRLQLQRLSEMKG